MDRKGCRSADGVTCSGMANPPQADRGRANRIRTKMRAALPVEPEDAAWIEAYDEDRAATPRKNGPEFGASARKSKRVSYTEETDEAQAVGVGNGAAMVAAQAAFAREDGRRLDSIIDKGINALVQAVKTYESMTQALLAERQADAALHRTLLESVRTHYLERTEAEAELIRADAEAEAAAASVEAAKSGDGGGVEGAILQMLLKQGLSSVVDEKPTNGSSGAKKSD